MTISLTSIAERRSSRAVLANVSAGLVATLALAWKALRRRPFSVSCTALLVVLSARLLGVPVPLVLLVWLLAALLVLATWHALEPFVLARLGCRPPGHLDRERLDPLLGPGCVDVLLHDAAEPWLGRGVRSLVLSRALLDLLEDRALAGLLAQAGEQVRAASLPGELVVWLGNLPLLSAWYLSRSLVQLGRLLAIVVGASLVLPLVVWPAGFTRWAGRLFGAAIVGLLGSALLSRGLSAAGPGPAAGLGPRARSADAPELGNAPRRDRRGRRHARRRPGLGTPRSAGDPGLGRVPASAGRSSRLALSDRRPAHHPRRPPLAEPLPTLKGDRLKPHLPRFSVPR